MSTLKISGDKNKGGSQTPINSKSTKNVKKGLGVRFEEEKPVSSRREGSVNDLKPAGA